MRRTSVVTAAAVLLVAACQADHGPVTAVRTPILAADGTLPITFAGAGNIAPCGYGHAEATAELLDTMPGFVFTAGDNAFPDGTPTDYQNCYNPTWGRFKARTYPAPGNHDYNASSVGAGYFGYFGSRAGTAGQGWYSFDLGTWHIVVLNDNIDISAGSPQEQFLKADLASTGQPCIAAIWHVPLFLSSSTSGYYRNLSRKPLWDDLYAARADVVLNGHQHDYERMAPMRPDGTRDDAAGITQFNSGGGGESIGMPTVIHPNSQSLAAVFGVLRMTLLPGGYTWQFVPIPGSSFSDTGSRGCHGGSGPPPPPPPPPPTDTTLVPRFVAACSNDRYCGFVDSSSDGNGRVVSWRWTFGDGSSSNLQNPSHRYGSNGSRTVTLTVTNDSGASASTSRSVTVPPPPAPAGDKAPQSRFAFSCAGRSCTFTDQSTDPDGSVVSWMWVFGDGTASTTRNPVHVYAAGGNYSARLIVGDNRGASNASSHGVSVH